MGKLTYVKGDLFLTKRKVIAHGCNTKGAFGAGVAAQIASLYPWVKQCYLNKYHEDGWKLGQIQVISVDGDRFIANLATQENYGIGVKQVDYNACFVAFNKLFDWCEKAGLDIAMPKIGSGLAGGSWEEVEKKLILSLNKYNVEVDVHYL